MNTTNPQWLSIPDVAEILGVTQRDVRNMLADHRLIALRQGQSKALAISPLVLVEKDGATEVLASLRGTLITLFDAGYSEEEAWAWLTAESPELSATPIEALRSGRVHVVRRLAATLAF
ncbi:MAG: Rv2175c family DNA-binding protein [Actinomycetaceae bacterium]|nr:Rv2175c family DNA-binding protein [Actinomycetaceae bacterium]